MIGNTNNFCRKCSRYEEYVLQLNGQYNQFEKDMEKINKGMRVMSKIIKSIVPMTTCDVDSVVLEPEELSSLTLTVGKSINQELDADTSIEFNTSNCEVWIKTENMASFSELHNDFPNTSVENGLGREETEDTSLLDPLHQEPMDFYGFLSSPEELNSLKVKEEQEVIIPGSDRGRRLEIIELRRVFETTTDSAASKDESYMEDQVPIRMIQDAHQTFEKGNLHIIKRKRGRPRKMKSLHHMNGKITHNEISKRKPGRPKKMKILHLINGKTTRNEIIKEDQVPLRTDQEAHQEPKQISSYIIKRKRGRPRKIKRRYRMIKKTNHHAEDPQNEIQTEDQVPLRADQEAHQETKEVSSYIIKRKPGRPRKIKRRYHMIKKTNHHAEDPRNEIKTEDQVPLRTDQQAHQGPKEGSSYIIKEDQVPLRTDQQAHQEPKEGSSYIIKRKPGRPRKFPMQLHLLKMTTHPAEYSQNEVMTNAYRRFGLTCTNCSTRATPVWRWNDKGEPLCNACGLHLRLYGVNRNRALKKEVLQRKTGKNKALHQADEKTSNPGSPVKAKALHQVDEKTSNPGSPVKVKALHQLDEETSNPGSPVKVKALHQSDEKTSNPGSPVKVKALHQADEETAKPSVDPQDNIIKRKRGRPVMFKKLYHINKKTNDLADDAHNEITKRKRGRPVMYKKLYHINKKTNNPPDDAHNEITETVARFGLSCSNCTTKTTPMWRRNDKGERLCNACGVYWRTYGVNRSLTLMTDKFKYKRGRPVKKQHHMNKKAKHPADHPHNEITNNFIIEEMKLKQYCAERFVSIDMSKEREKISNYETITGITSEAHHESPASNKHRNWDSLSNNNIPDMTTPMCSHELPSVDTQINNDETTTGTTNEDHHETSASNKHRNRDSLSNNNIPDMTTHMCSRELPSGVTQISNDETTTCTTNEAQHETSTINNHRNLDSLSNNNIPDITTTVCSHERPSVITRISNDEITTCTTNEAHHETSASNKHEKWDSLCNNKAPDSPQTTFLHDLSLVATQIIDKTQHLKRSSLTEETNSCEMCPMSKISKACSSVASQIVEDEGISSIEVMDIEVIENVQQKKVLI